MNYIQTNPNPLENDTGDCVVRAICIAENRNWDDVYLDLMIEGFFKKRMIEDNRLWIPYLRKRGYRKYNIPDTCPDDCYLLSDFVRDHPQGRYIVGTGSHTIAVIDGIAHDTWNSLDKVVLFYFTKED